MTTTMTTPAHVTRALAELQAELYLLPSERFAEHARPRAEEDWRGIDELPQGSWRSLHAVVNSESSGRRGESL